MRVNDANLLTQRTKHPVTVSALGFGGAGLDNLLHAINNQTAADTVQTARSSGIGYFDTAPFYGLGLSEDRLGASLAGHPVTLSTKVGRVLVEDPIEKSQRDAFINTPQRKVNFDYSYDGIFKSFEASVARLGRRPDIVLVHDLDTETHGADQARAHLRDLVDNGSLKALAYLQTSGDVAAIGGATNSFPSCETLMEYGDFDCFMIAGCYTLLEQGPLLDTLPKLLAADIGVLLGGPFNSGILATDAVQGAKYNYQDASPEILTRVARIERISSDHDVPLIAAALQFPAAHPVIKSVVCGAQYADHVRANKAAFEMRMLKELWADLKTADLLHGSAPIPQPQD